MDGQVGLHDQAEAAQHAEQLAVAEGLAAGREADSRRYSQIRRPV
jgi:hypothetical protein